MLACITLHFAVNQLNYPILLLLPVADCWLLSRLDLGFLILRNNKPLDHWPFREQVVKQPAVSPEVTYGGAKKQVSLLKWLWFPELMSLLRIYRIDLLRIDLLTGLLT